MFIRDLHNKSFPQLKVFIMQLFLMTSTFIYY